MKSGWVTKKLGEVCAFSKDGGNWRNLPYVGLEDIESKTARFTGSTAPKAVQSLTFRFHPGQVLYGRLRPYLQKGLLAKNEGHCSTEIFPIQPAQNLNAKYLLYWLLSDDVTAKIDETCRGARMPRANMNEVLEFPIPIPSLAEQKRIVAKIDAAFEKIDKLKANAEKNLANAKELFQSALDEAMRPKKGWVEKRLGEVANVRVGPFGSSLHKADYVDAGVPLVNPCHMKSLRIAEDISTQVSYEKANELNDYRLSTGDIVFARRGEIGRLAFVSERENGYLCGTGSLFARFIEKFEIRFLYYSFSSPEFVRRLEKLSTGTTMKSINSSALESMVFFSPPIAEQQQISKRLDLLSLKLETLQQNYERQVADCAEMRQAILREAFEGRL